MDNQISRRDFVKAGSSTAALLASTPLVYAGGQDQTISVGLIGCGGRGTGAAENCLESSPNVKLVAMGDMFKDRLDGSRRNLSKRDGYKVSDDNVFVGFDAYKKVLDSGVDPTGIRTVLEYGKKAKEKKLAVVTGTQRRHQKDYVETIAKIHEGAIG